MSLELENLAESQFLKALDALYERGANDQHDGRRFDARGCREYQAVLDMLRAPQWLPIESAPRDGTLILLGRAGDDADDRLPISTPGRWFEGYENGVDYMGHDDGFMDTDFQEFSCPRTFGAESYRSSGFQPTHWQPLPAPPEVQP